MMTTINGVEFGNRKCYTLKGIIAELKRKGRYHKCRVCGKKYVEKEGDVCENCKYFAGLVYKEDGKN